MNTLSYFETEPSKSEDDKQTHQFLDGICPKCLGTGYVHDIRDGVLGVVMSVIGSDEFGRPLKRLQKCHHDTGQFNY